MTAELVVACAVCLVVGLWVGHWAGYAQALTEQLELEHMRRRAERHGAQAGEACPTCGRDCAYRVVSDE